MRAAAALADDDARRRRSSSVASSPALARRRICRRRRSRRQLRRVPETKVWREAEVLPPSGVRSVSPLTSRSRHRHAQGVGADLRHDGVGSLADVDGAAEERQRAVAARGRCAWWRDWTARCCRCRTTCRRRRRRGAACRAVRLNASAPRAAPLPGRTQRLQARRKPTLSLEHLAGRGGDRPPPARCRAELQRIEAELLGQIVDQRLLGDRRLGHAEAAEGAGGRVVGVDRARRARDSAARIGAGWRARARDWRRSGPRRHRRRC